MTGAGDLVRPPLTGSVMDVMSLQFAGTTRPVVLIDAAKVVEGIGGAVKGWPWVARCATVADLSDPLTCITREGTAYVASSVYLDAPMTGLPAASAVCGVLADLSEAVFDQWPDAIALHAGAAEICGRVVAFTGPARAGKSTLMARLTAETDMTVYCDDVLPVMPGGEALALGLAPRLRLPLPIGASEQFRQHVAAFAGIADDKYAYLPAPTVASHGTRGVLGAMVILDRRAHGPAQFHAVEATETAAHLLARDMQEPADAAAHLARVTALAESVPCLRLVYADLEDAVTAIRAAFGTDEWPAANLLVKPPVQRDRMARKPVVRPADPGLRMVRDPMAVLRRGSTGLWLVRRGGVGAFHLNQVAGAVWELLAEPATGAEIAADLAEVFPDVNARRIAADVAMLLGGLLDAGLVMTTDSESDTSR